MPWTPQHPTQEGWYWFRMDSEEKRMVIVYVISADRMVAVGSDTEGNPALQKGAWYGPLEAPEYEERESQP